MAASSITMGKFVAGIVAAILVSSAISIVVSTLLITGRQGPQGPVGATGVTGAAGAAGAAGATGATGATGSQGPAGANGATWLNGTGVPSSSLGTDGDFYLNLANSDAYNKISGSWVWVANIRGARGATGPAGATVVNSSILTGGLLVYLPAKNLGNVTLTAPANGTVQVTLTAYLEARNDSSSMWLTSNATGFSGWTEAGPPVNGLTASEYSYYSLTTQGVYSVIAGNTYYFNAQAWRQYNPNDSQDYGYLIDVYITAVFYAT